MNLWFAITIYHYSVEISDKYIFRDLEKNYLATLFATCIDRSLSESIIYPPYLSMTQSSSILDADLSIIKVFMNAECIDIIFIHCVYKTCNKRR